MAPSTSATTEAAVLAAALRVFAERTYDGTSVPLIAERAGVAPGTLYRYWPGKEALANAVYRQAKQSFADYLSRGRAGEEIRDAAGLRAAFEAMWHNMTEFARAEPEALRFLEHQQHAGYLDEESQELTRRVEALGVGLIEAGQRLGVFRRADPGLLVAMVFGAYVGLSKTAQAGVPVKDPDLRDAGEALWGLLLA